MSTYLAKVAAAFTAAGMTGASGFGAWKILNKNKTISIRNKVLASYGNRFSTFLLVGDSNWEKIKEEYGKSEAIYKPTRGGVDIKKDELPAWCENTVDSSFDERDNSKLDAVLRWCYVNTNNFQTQAEKLNKELHAGGSGDSAWKDAWETVYKGLKNDAQWKINYEDSELNGEDKEKGGPSLQKWCSSKLSIFMFSNEAPDSFPKFEKFCLKNKAG
ncbi:hypothetical protein MHC_02190 [Mycoplasma haemocanis str. Illinois]|uniref:Uncharacterized protein n=1 Tax=Mycoplasma haemocanis (strain Illinois) TaxID=1111676 RepID=H6N6N2_MYCHN|nr:hypothetical protein [Mycoplasma haemocanis]AEW45304.1 hypothetical protein MHC_02190 [Mycoplasma haemocanis str. Illinois]